MKKVIRLTRLTAIGISVFCIGLIWAFAAAHLLGNILFSFAWVSFGLTLLFWLSKGYTGQ